MKHFVTVPIVLAASVASAAYVRSATETYPGGGSGGGITPAVATNISAAVVQRDVAQWAMAGQPKPSGGVTEETVTNIAQSVSESVVDSRIVGDRLVWSSPDEWKIDYYIIRTSVSVTNGAGYVDEWHRCITQSVVNTTKTLQAQCSAVLTDEISIKIPTGVVWTCETTGGSITQNGLLTATVPGIYKINAVDSLSRKRYENIAIQQPVQRTEITDSYYANDESGSVRKTVNDQAYAVLDSATSVGTYNYGGKTYTLYNTFVPRMTSVGRGNSSCFAVSAHVLASAQHWGLNKPLGTQTFDDGAGHSATVTKTAWVKLSDWAIDHGFSKSEVSEAHVDDIALITCDSSAAVPDGCIPYFIRPETRETWFGPSLLGVSGWFFGQDHNQAIPVVFDTDGSWSKSSNPIMTTYYAARADIKSKLVSMGQQYIVHTGDSGKPVFIRKDGHDIIVSAFYTPAGGPCYIEGFKIIKAFVESVGDTLKEAN